MQTLLFIIFWFHQFFSVKHGTVKSKSGSMNSILSPLSDTAISEKQAARGIVNSIRSSLKLPKKTASDIEQEFSVSHFLLIDNIRQELDQMDLKNPEDLKTKIIELLNLESFEEFRTPLNEAVLKESVLEKTKITIQLIITTLEHDILRRISENKIDLSEFIEIPFNHDLIDQSVLLVIEQLKQIEESYQMSFQDVWDQTESVLFVKLKLYSDNFLESISQVLEILSRPSQLLQKELIHLTEKSIQLKQYDNINRSRFLISLIAKFSDDAQINNIFSYLFLKLQLSETSPEFNRYIIFGIRSLCQAYYSDENASKITKLLAYFLQTEVKNSLTKPESFAFIRLFCSTNNRQKYSIQTAASLLLLNEHEQLNADEFNFLMENLEDLLLSKNKVFEQIEFANLFLLNDLIKVSETHYWFFSQLFEVIFENEKMETLTFLSLDRTLDQKKIQEKVDLNVYFFAKVLNSILANLNSEKFDFVFEISETEKEDFNSLIFEISKVDRFENILVDIYEHKTQAKLDKKITRSGLLQEFTQTQYNTIDFNAAKINEFEIERHLKLECSEKKKLEVKFVSEKSTVNTAKSESSNEQISLEKLEELKKQEDVTKTTANIDSAEDYDPILEGLIYLFDEDK